MRMSALLFAMWTPLRVDQAALQGVGTAVASELAICRRPLLWTGREAWSFHLCAGMTADCAVWPGRLASCTSGRQLYLFSLIQTLISCLVGEPASRYFLKARCGWRAPTSDFATRRGHRMPPLSSACPTGTSRW